MWGSRAAPGAALLLRASASGAGRASSSAGGHRRLKSIDSLADLTLPLNPGELLSRIASEAWLCTGLAFNLWSYLGLGWKWLINFYRLVLYAAFLLPGFIQMIAYYFTSDCVRRSIPYGRKPRQRLDMYIPRGSSSSSNNNSNSSSNSSSHGGGGSQQQQPLLPVVIFVTGGAWTIGYKAWGALLARRLCDAGALVCCLDYRNFPQGSASDMVEDVNTGIAWVLRKIERYNGCPEDVWLVGQSAGGQLALLALLNQAAQAASGGAVWGGAPLWHPGALAGFVGVSGAYDLEGLAEHLHRRGLYRNLLDTIMSVDGKVAYELLSPLHAARNPPPNLAAFLPPLLLLHGTADKSVPAASSLLLADALQAAGCAASVQLLLGKTHTDLLLEDAMAGGRDVLTEAILGCITGRSEEFSYPPMCPRALVRLAGWVCPF